MNSIAYQYEQLLGVPLKLGDPITSSISTNVEFIVTQYHIAVANSKATGFRLSAADFISNYGIDRTLDLVDYLSAPIIEGRGEPLERFQKTADELGISFGDVLAEHMTPALHDKIMSTRGQIPFRALDKIAQKLGIPLREIGKKKPAIDQRADFRARSLSHESRLSLQSDQVSLIAECIRIADDFWQLSNTFASFTRPLKLDTLQRREVMELRNWSKEYRHLEPWLQGNLLATRLREYCQLKSDAPIKSFSRWVEYKFNLPVLTISGSDSLSGMTVRSETGRLICVNKALYDGDAFVRRASVAHELAHALFDDDDELAAVRVDQKRVFDDRIIEADPVEQRANAFAAEILAPKAAILTQFNSSGRDREGLLKVALHFGVSSKLAYWQLSNADAGHDYGHLSKPSGGFGDVKKYAKAGRYRNMTKSERTLGELVFEGVELAEIRKSLVSLYAAQLYKLGLITADRLLSVLGWPEVDLREVMRQVEHHPPHFLPASSVT